MRLLPAPPAGNEGQNDELAAYEHVGQGRRAEDVRALACQHVGISATHSIRARVLLAGITLIL